MLLPPAPQMFTTITTFAKFAKFAKFANIDSALEHPTPIHLHPPCVASISERTFLTTRPPLPANRAGYPSGGVGVRVS